MKRGQCKMMLLVRQKYIHAAKCYHHFSHKTLSTLIPFAFRRASTTSSVITGGPQTYATVPSLVSSGPSESIISSCVNRRSYTSSLSLAVYPRIAWSCILAWFSGATPVRYKWSPLLMVAGFEGPATKMPFKRSRNRMESMFSDRGNRHE